MAKKDCMKFIIMGVCILMFVIGCSSKNADSENNRTNIEIDNSMKDKGNENSPVSQEDNAQSQEDIEQVLADYRSDRKKGESDTPDGYVLAIAPNEENYNFGVGNLGYTSRFDAKEVGEATKTAEKYINDTLQIESPIYLCADPRMTAIYDDIDKGVANGYDADNIFLCEYSENDKWRYIILVREKKGEKWTVLFHGDTYKAELDEVTK